MKCILLVCQISSAVAALLAAWYWFQSAKGKSPPDTWEGIGLLPGFLDKAAQQNRIAATWAGVSAMLTAATTLVGLSI